MSSHKSLGLNYEGISEVPPKKGGQPPGELVAFLDTYRTMCVAPEPAFRRVLEEIREMRLAA